MKWRIEIHLQGCCTFFACSLHLVAHLAWYARRTALNAVQNPVHTCLLIMHLLTCQNISHSCTLHIVQLYITLCHILAQVWPAFSPHHSNSCSAARLHHPVCALSKSLRDISRLMAKLRKLIGKEETSGTQTNTSAVEELLHCGGFAAVGAGHGRGGEALRTILEGILV